TYNGKATVIHCALTNNSALNGGDFFTMGDATNAQVVLANSVLQSYAANTLNGGGVQTTNDSSQVAAPGAPWVAGPYSETIPSGAQAVFSLTIADPGGPYNLIATSSDQNVFADANMVLAGSNPETLTATASGSAGGSSQMALTMTY